MKKASFALAGLLLLFGLASPLRAQVLFTDNFEAGNLDQWVGKLGGPHHGQIVSDPLNSTNHVLTFTSVNSGGDIFNAAPISLSGLPQPIVLSFDFLALSTGGTVPEEFGGFAGVTTDPDGVLPHYWLGGTFPPALNVPAPVATTLAADGQWHHYAIDFTAVSVSNQLTSIQVMLEDWFDRGSIPGDVYFDNVRLGVGVQGAIEQQVPCAGPLAGGKWKSHGQYTTAVIQAVRAYLQQGLISTQEAERIIVVAGQSDCGK